MGRIPEVVLRGRGVVFRLETYTVRVMRGRVTWTVPLAAIEHVEHAGGHVLLKLSRDAAVSTEDNNAFTLTTRNTTAADAFVRQLRTALRRRSASAQGPTQVVREVTGRRLPRLPPISAGGMIALGVGPYIAFFYVAGEKGAEVGIGGLMMAIMMFYCPFGWLMLYIGWTKVMRDALILRRRGITVPGRIRDYAWHRISKDQSEWRPVYEFRTLEGRHLVVTQPVGRTHKGEKGPVDVTYDPLSPTRVRNLRDKRLTISGIAQTFFGMLGVVLMVIPLWLFISALLTGW
ncbi:DUF3592 domain-containing protein [Streptomyces sp. NPDC057654]|uniref:DUF3592 domain-containing protein n=1 Tax=Streptomyces sp. NPDC057654 TaxID=3346196 RepID=UPI00367DAB35